MVLVTSALAMVACGSDDGNDSAQQLKARSRPAAPAPSPPSVGGGAPAPSPGPQRAVRQFRRGVNERCEDAGTVARVSASAGLDDRRQEMERELRGLDRLKEALADVEAPTRKLTKLMGRYLRRLDAQILLDRRIARAAKAGDSHSVEIGMSQNEYNREARNHVVEAAGFGGCLRARAPR